MIQKEGKNLNTLYTNKYINIVHKWESYLLMCIFAICKNYALIG